MTSQATEKMVEEKQKSTAPMRKFRLKQGVAPHFETPPGGTEKEYKGGEVVESDRDLPRLFPGKFEEPGVEDEELREAIQEKDQKIAELEAELAELRGSRQADFAQAGGDKPAAKDLHEIPTPPEPVAEPSPDELELQEELGDEVSDDFPTAAEGRLRVFHKGRNYAVVDSEGKELNFKPITRKEDVESFIDRQIKKQQRANQ